MRAGLKSIDGYCADPDPDESKGGVADGSGHAADLAVLALRERQLKPGCWDILPDADRHFAWVDLGSRFEERHPRRSSH